LPFLLRRFAFSKEYLLKKTVSITESNFTNRNMKPNHKQNRRVPATIVNDRKQPANWLVLRLPFLRCVNMRTLALLMFVGFAVLNTTRGKDAEIKDPAFAGNIGAQVIDNRQHEDAQPPSGPTNRTTSKPSILWQLASKLVKGFGRALNDPALIQYAKEQGVDTSSLPAALSQDHAHQSRISSVVPATY
jgi:hypothetical protein